MEQHQISQTYEIAAEAITALRAKFPLLIVAVKLLGISD